MWRENVESTGDTDVGDTSMDPAAQAWSDFCRTLDAAGQEVLRTGETAMPVSQAEGLRYLTRLLRSGVEKFIEYSDPDAPFLGNVYNEKLKWGLDNPDSLYAMCNLHGGAIYEITGNAGSVNYFNFTTAQMSPDAQYRIIDEARDFRVVVGGERRDGNWVPLPPDANSLLIRQTFGDRAREQPMTFTIRRIDEDDSPAPMTMSTAVEGLVGARNFFERTSRTFLGLADSIRQHTNSLPRVDQEFMLSLGGDPNYAYFWGGFLIDEGEALAIHFSEIPAAENWNLCLYNYWLESLDYTRGQILMNQRLAQPNPDGSLTIIVAHEDPGMPNWLNPLGHKEGAIMSRWIMPETVVEPVCRLVNLDNADRAHLGQRWPVAIS